MIGAGQGGLTEYPAAGVQNDLVLPDAAALLSLSEALPPAQAETPDESSRGLLVALCDGQGRVRQKSEQEIGSL